MCVLVYMCVCFRVSMCCVCVCWRAIILRVFVGGCEGVRGAMLDSIDSGMVLHQKAQCGALPAYTHIPENANKTKRCGMNGLGCYLSCPERSTVTTESGLPGVSVCVCV